MTFKNQNVIHPQNLKSLMDNFLRWVDIQGMVFQFFLLFFNYLSISSGIYGIG